MSLGETEFIGGVLDKLENRPGWRMSENQLNRFGDLWDRHKSDMQRDRRSRR